MIQDTSKKRLKSLARRNSEAAQIYLEFRSCAMAIQTTGAGYSQDVPCSGTVSTKHIRVLMFSSSSK